MKPTLFFLIFLSVYNNSFSQRPGTLDKTFANNGLYISSSPGYFQASVLLNNDKILILSSDSIGIALFRYLPDGSPDESFGYHGRLSTSSFPFVIQHLAVQYDKIIVGGFTFPSRRESIVVMRLNENGSVDSTFANNGSFIDSSVRPERVADMIIQTDGKLVIYGSAHCDGDNGTADFLLLRLTPDGKIDDTFGTHGKTLLTISMYVEKIALAPDGKIVCAGNEGGRSALMRFTDVGTLDQTFGASGFVVTEFDKFSDGYKDVCVQNDGKILAAGIAMLESRNEQDLPYISLARYNIDGTLDSTFAYAGKAKAFQNMYATGTSLVLQKNGKPVVCGSAFDGTASSSVIARFTKDGLKDTTFGNQGETIEDVTPGYADGAKFAHLQFNGKIVLTGYGSDESFYYYDALSRYYGDPVKQTSPIVKKIKRWIKNHTLQWQPMNDQNISYYSIQRSDNSPEKFKEIARVSAVYEQTSNASSIYSYDLTKGTREVQQTTGIKETSYRITAVLKSENITSDVIRDNNGSNVVLTPNPVKNILKISGLNANHKTFVNIINSSGSILKSETCNSAACIMDVSQLMKGIYNVQIKDNGKVQTVKMAKE